MTTWGEDGLQNCLEDGWYTISFVIVSSTANCSRFENWYDYSGWVSMVILFLYKRGDEELRLELFLLLCWSVVILPLEYHLRRLWLWNCPCCSYHNQHHSYSSTIMLSMSIIHFKLFLDLFRQSHIFNKRIDMTKLPRKFFCKNTYWLMHIYNSKHYSFF